DPEITFPVVAKYPFAELPTRPTSREQVAFAIEVHPRGFGLRLADKTNVINSLGWVVTNWESALDLMETSAEFKLAMEVFEVGQFNRSTAMTLVSLWGGLEAIFSANTSELRFRVSSMIASYLYAAGQQRLETQQQIAKLYDLRSAAAHGRPKHDGNQVLQTFELFRKVLIRIIVNKRVPTRADLDNMLLGGVVG
ncbi:MAG: HEPN domain-containing protein, partial [Polaromonas sp.]|nr:HEPN domain-containing protein [Polaromonas sp.]